MTTTSSTSSTSGGAILSAFNAGSGIDTTALVTNLVAASFDPKDSALKTKEDANTARISALGTLSSGIDTFTKALQTLVAGGTLKSQPTSSDPSVLTAATKAGAAIGNLSAQLQVRQLATAQSSYSPPLTASSSAVGLGSLTLTKGTGAAAQSFQVTIDSSNNTLDGLAQAINATNSGSTPSGLSASVVTDSSGARLVVKGASGAANGFTIEADSGASSDLARFATAGTGAQMVQAQPAQDAIIRMDGVDSTYATNSVGDLIPGVTLNLVKASPATTVTLGVARPTDAIGSAVNDFVSAYNELKAQFDTATAIGSGGTGQGPLSGNSAIKQLQRQLRSLTSTPLTGYPDGPRTLAEIGVSTGQDGTLSVDSTKLNKALATYPDAIEAMFNPTQRSSSPLVQITSPMGSTKPGTYTITDITAGPPAAANIGTTAFLPSASDPSILVASVTTDAKGLAIKPLGDVASMTITVESGLAGALQAISDGMRASHGILDTQDSSSLTNALSNEKKRLADSRTKLESQEEAYKDQLTAQFTAMQTRVASYKSIQSYMTQQIDMWSKS